MKSMKEGRYLYCVVNAKEKTSLGTIGIEDSEVYAILFQDIAAVVHRCGAHPYDTSKEEKARDWILAHLYTIDKATMRFGTPLPFRFDTIIRGGDDEVVGWLRKEYLRLKEALNVVRGKAEYGIQVFWERDMIAEKIMAKREIKELERMIEGKPRGVAYIFKLKTEAILKEELSAEAEEQRKKIYDKISTCVAKVKMAKAKAKAESWQGKDMLLNLSCLAHSGQAEELGKVLEEIKVMPGIEVRFTGPWPPYNFSGGGEHEAN